MKNKVYNVLIALLTLFITGCLSYSAFAAESGISSPVTSDNNSGWLIYLLIGSGVLLIILICVLIFMNKKKK